MDFATQSALAFGAMEAQPTARDAAARLGYAGTVRVRARQAALSPAPALVVLGAIAAIHGTLATLWPHDNRVAVVWVVALVAARPLVRSLRLRAARRRGVFSSARLPIACATAAIAAYGVAIAAGANGFLAAIAAATALAAYVAGLPQPALAAAGAGLFGELAIARGLAPGLAEIVVGVGLAAAGATIALHNRETA